MEKAIINQKEAQNGITLIALVITIIVLLILAGVSIAMLTGQNGILTQAQTSKKETDQSKAEEKIKLAIMSARSRSNTASLELDKLKEEITNQGGASTNNEFPLSVTMDGKTFTVASTGEVTATDNSNPSSGGTLETVTGTETTNTTVKDNLGNQVVVPAGFKVVNPDDNVTDGIIIEDISHEATAGSQFVWIPVGDVIKDSNGNKEIITLSRYTFANNSLGTPEIKGEDKISNGYSENYTEDTTSDHNISYGNTIAKDIEKFKNKVTNITHGYYIGRYEARRNGTQLTVKETDTVYNNIAQADAATASRGMYSDGNFESDLVNSYAWDTTIVFLQKFDNRENKENLKVYSQQDSLNTEDDGVASKGTNNLEDKSKQDKICNVWDMASNCLEWTTETYRSSGNGPCTLRGGYLYNSYYCTSSRDGGSIDSGKDGNSFRIILYF